MPAFSTVSDQRWTIDFAELRARDPKLADGWGPNRTPPAGTRNGIIRYKVWRLPSVEDEPDFVSVALVADMDGTGDIMEQGDKSIDGWRDARQKDVDGRWTVKYSKAKLRADGTKPVDIAIPVYGYKSHVSMDRMHGLIRCQTITDAARHDGGQLREGLIARTNTSRLVWADSAYRSAENEDWLEARGMVSRIHRKKPRSRPMPKQTGRANAVKSAVRSKVEHVFAYQKARMRIVIRTIGIARTAATITLANMAYNMTRWRWLDGRAATA